MLGRRQVGVLREAIDPLTMRRAVLVVVSNRFVPRMRPDPELVLRAADVEQAATPPLLDAGILDDGAPWFVCDAPPAPTVDAQAGCSPRRAVTTIEQIALALATLHAAGVVHGLIGPHSVVPAPGRHSDAGNATAVLLDSGVAALLGDGAAELAIVSGVALPTDTGPAADVYALGGLLLRMLTAAAPPSAALAALPVDLRALMTAMLDPAPAARPTAGAVAARLAGFRSGLPATGQITAPPAADRVLETVTTPRVRPMPARPPAPARPSAPAPAPVRATVSTAAPIHVPRAAADPAVSMRTGAVAVIGETYPRPARRGDLASPRRSRLRTAALAAGGVGLAGLVLVVATHLPVGPQTSTVAAGADGVLVGAGTGPTGDTGATTGSVASARASASATSHAASASTTRQVTAKSATRASASPAFVLPAPTAVPMAAAQGHGGSASHGDTSATGTSVPASTAAATTSTGFASPSATPGDSGSASSTPSDSTPAVSISAASTATPSTATPSDSATASDSASTTPSATPSDSANASDSATPSATAAPDSTAPDSTAPDSTAPSATAG